MNFRFMYITVMFNDYYEVNYQNKYNHSTIQMEIKSAATNTYERNLPFSLI